MYLYLFTGPGWHLAGVWVESPEGLRESKRFGAGTRVSGFGDLERLSKASTKGFGVQGRRSRAI